MIFCNLDPSLLIFNELGPDDLVEAKRILDILTLHQRQIIRSRAEIPITSEYMIHILDSLNSIPIKNPPIQQPLKILITNLLGRTVSPPLPPTKITDTIISPEITKEWVNDDTKLLWLDCLLSALYDKISNIGVVQGQKENIVATYGLPVHVENLKLTSQDLGKILESVPEWQLPLVTTDAEWIGLLAEFREWPHGLESALIELYAYRNLGVYVENIPSRHPIDFEAPCLRDISNETNTLFRNKLIEIIACRAYDKVKPQHFDHKHDTKPGIRRVWVRKMKPSVRLHYYIDGEKIIYCMYENQDHDRGL